MHYFFGGLALLIFLIFAARTFVKADPKKLAQTLRKIGGWAMVLLSTLLALRGLFPIAVPMALVAAALLGRGFSFPSGFPGGFGPSPGRADKSQGQSSRVRTDHLEMNLDHDSGAMDGIVIKGAHEGARLSALNLEALIGLLRDYRTRDPQSAQLLEAFLERTQSDWREAAGEHAQGKPSGDAADGAMTLDEAFEVLGLAKGTDAKEIHSAHRRLMKKLHPDQGGSTYLAAKINQAKDIALASVQ